MSGSEVAKLLGNLEFDGSAIPDADLVGNNDGVTDDSTAGLILQSLDDAEFDSLAAPDSVAIQTSEETF
jgi:hypothetical protein